MVELKALVAYVDALLGVERYDEGEPANALLIDAGRPALPRPRRPDRLLWAQDVDTRAHLQGPLMAV